MERSDQGANQWCKSVGRAESFRLRYNPDSLRFTTDLQETLDNGKPIRETRAADIPLASDHFRYFASVIRAEEGVANQLDSEDLSLILREPIGVVGQIIPWNFPFLMAAWKIAPALAAGCTVVIHPSSTTSLSLLSLAQKINHLLPKGVFNVITGKGSKSGE